MIIRRFLLKTKHFFQRRTRGWSDDDCWNLEQAFMFWLLPHLKIYRRDADQVIDLTWHKIQYKNKTYTLLFLLNKLIMLTEQYILVRYYYESEDVKEIQKLYNEVLNIYRVILPYLNW